MDENNGLDFGSIMGKFKELEKEAIKKKTYDVDIFIDMKNLLLDAMEHGRINEKKMH